ncbi:MAG TPA: hypothetical protein DCQ93_04930 [Bacteroidetes bacterium]|mgnify:CR=1 FL=1|nr:hypothetical protein [Bacteroidota bacterium]
MKSKAEKIYEAIGKGYGYNGSKEECIEIIEGILNSDDTVNKNLPKPPFLGSVCDHEWTVTGLGNDYRYCKLCGKTKEG